MPSSLRAGTRCSRGCCRWTCTAWTTGWRSRVRQFVVRAREMTPAAQPTLGEDLRARVLAVTAPPPPPGTPTPAMLRACSPSGAAGPTALAPQHPPPQHPPPQSRRATRRRRAPAAAGPPAAVALRATQLTGRAGERPISRYAGCI